VLRRYFQTQLLTCRDAKDSAGKRDKKKMLKMGNVGNKTKVEGQKGVTQQLETSCPHYGARERT